ncbi:MAG: gephyrin-like molybdotransferase Glp [Acetobacter okinawensis]|uniref:molybdopterin molybdotransferase MoeA n=1 Tax=Acetobacter okinawensis TaxID=1076594 RepID=UPI0039E9BA7B
MRIQRQKVKLSYINMAPRTPKGDEFMLDVATARARILENLPSCGQETVALTAACGRILAQDVQARRANPPVHVSAMDGYAVRAADAQQGAILRVIDEAPAGRPSSRTVGAGECIRLFTGSQVPSGADCIVIQENTERAGEQVTLTRTASVGQNIRTQGQDFAQGDVLLRAGSRLGARDIGLAAAGGLVWLPVVRRPRVGILATGDEILLPGDTAPPDGIFNSASFMLAALLGQEGAEAHILPVARDNAASLSAAFAHIRDLDMLVTIGGASVGTYDLVRPTLEKAGLIQNFWKIAMRPGKPLMSGTLNGMPVLGLPGNPVAALVCGMVFVLPALHKLMGRPVADTLQTQPALLGADVEENDQRQDFLRATLHTDEEGRLFATPFGLQGSGQLNSLAHSQALIVRAPHASAQKAGTPCRILHLP